MRKNAHPTRDSIELRYWKVKRGTMSLRQVAEEVDCSVDYVQRVIAALDKEKGHPQISKVYDIEDMVTTEPKIVQMYRPREPKHVREFELEKREEVHPKRVDEVGGKIVLTYESRLNYERD